MRPIHEQQTTSCLLISASPDEERDDRYSPQCFDTAIKEVHPMSFPALTPGASGMKKGVHKLLFLVKYNSHPTKGGLFSRYPLCHTPHPIERVHTQRPSSLFTISILLQ
jgi:hypothetical protein